MLKSQVEQLKKSQAMLECEKAALAAQSQAAGTLGRVVVVVCYYSYYHYYC
jgi:hypothetical protein